MGSTGAVIVGRHKKQVSEKNRPHSILEMMLQGARVPEDFSCDGCTTSPDLHFVWACNVHDYDSAKSSENWRTIMQVVDEMGEKWDSEYIVPDFWKYDSELGKYIKVNLRLKQAFETWYTQFESMTNRLKHNIHILSKWKVVNNELRKRKIYDPKRILGYRLSRLYARATGNWFTSWAE